MNQPSPIRIICILEAYSVTGPAKAVIEFFREARRPGADPCIDLSVLTFLRGNNSENSFTRAVHAEGLPLLVVTESGPTDRTVLASLRRIVDQVKPHIIWTNGVKSHFLIRAAGLHRKSKWIAFHHGYTTTDLKTLAYNQLDRWSHGGAARVVTVCERFAAHLASRGITRDRLFVEHMPLRPQGPVTPDLVAETRKALALPPDESVILAVGRLSKEKGHAELIRAFARLRQANPRPMRVLIAGSGPELEPLRLLCQKLGVQEQVHFLGHRDPVRPLYGVADLFVLTSHSEGSPNVLLEAMDAGVPIVATSVGGVPEIATDEVSALLVEKQNVEQIASAMGRLLEDRDLRSRLVEGGRAVLSRHTPERYFARLAGLFAEVAGS